MSAELITAALLNVSGVTSLVGTRRALWQLPQGSTFPALTYFNVGTNALMTINAAAGPQKMMSRVQVTALANNPDGVAQLLAAIVSAMNLKSGTYAGKYVAESIRDNETGIERDNDAGVWFASQDFIIHWYE